MLMAMSVFVSGPVTKCGLSNLCKMFGAVCSEHAKRCADLHKMFHSYCTSQIMLNRCQLCRSAPVSLSSGFCCVCLVSRECFDIAESVVSSV